MLRRKILLFAGFVLIVHLLAVVDVSNHAFAMGSAPCCSLGTWVTPSVQKVNAGGSATYYGEVSAEWRDFFNATVGSATTREQELTQNLMVGPLPEGVEAIYPKTIYYDNPNGYHSFPIEIKVSPDIKYSIINLTIFVEGKYLDETKYAADDFWLYVAPRNTSIGVASTVLHEGFDRERIEGWDLMTDGGTVGLSVVSYVNRVPTHYLKLNDRTSLNSVAANRSIPLLKGSFIVEFALRSWKIYRFQLKFELQDSDLGEVLSAELTDGTIRVQNVSYGPYESNRWYWFRFEVDSDNRMLKWFLDDAFMDALPWRGSPDKVKVSTSDSGIGVGDVDDIFIQEIMAPDGTFTATTTVTVTKTSTISEPTTIRLPATLENLEEVRELVVNLNIKLPDPSTLPEGYELRAVMVDPIGPEMPETFSGRMFRPEMIHLYYSDKPFNESIMVSGYTEYLLISENYCLGSNSTQPYTMGQDIPPDMTVGWFYGYPGFMKGNIILVYQFEKEMAYRLYSLSLTQEEMLAVAKSLLLDNDVLIRVSPESQKVSSLGSVSFIVNLLPIEDFTGTLELDVDMPNGLTAEIEPDHVEIYAFGERQSILTVKIPSDTFFENASLIVSAIDLQDEREWRSNTVDLNFIPPLTRTITTTTTLSTTISSTTTSTELVTEPLPYAWAIGATVMVAILGVVLILKKRS